VSAAFDWPTFGSSCADGLTFREEGHVYEREAAQLISVTTVVKTVLPDKANVRRFWTESARRRGTVAHACTALDDAGRLDESSIAPAVRGRVDAWRAFRRAHPDFTPHLIEQPLWSVSGIAGTADRFGVWRDKLVVLDIKSAVDEPYARLQTAGYAALFTERTNVRCAVRIVVGLADDGSFDAHIWDSATEWSRDRAAWESASRLYAYLSRFDLLPDGGERR